MPSSAFRGTGWTKRMLIRKEASGCASVTARVLASTTLMPATSWAVPSVYSFAPWIEASFERLGLAVALARMPFMANATSSAVTSLPSEYLAPSCSVKVKVRPSIFQALARPGFGSKVSGLMRTSWSKSIFTRQAPSVSV